MRKKHSRFTLSHASLNPYLSLRALDINRQSENVYRVVAVIENNGFLPTYTSQKALERNDARPIEAELQLPEGVSLISGERRRWSNSSLRLFMYVYISEHTWHALQNCVTFLLTRRYSC